MLVEEQTTRVRRCLPYLIFLSWLAVYLYPFLRIFWGSGDEGTLVYGAIRVTEGQIPLRDFFEVIGPGSFYWLALFFKMFGTGILATRISVALTSIFTALLLYFLARRLKTGYDAVPAMLLMAGTFGGLWPAISHHNDSNLFALLAFTIILFWIDKHRPWMLCLAGVLAGVTTLILQPKGLLLFLSFVLLAFLFRGEAGLRSSLGWLTGSYLAVGLAVVLLYWKVGGLGGLFYADVVWPITNYSGVNAVAYGHGIREFYWEPWITVLGTVCPQALAFAITSLLVIPLLFVAALPAIGTLLVIFCRRFAFHSSALPYWIAGVAMWLSEIHRRDSGHLVYGSPLLIIPCLHYLAQGRRRMHLYVLQLICISTFVLALFNGGIVLAARAKITSRRGTFYALQPNPVLEFLNTHIKVGEEIFAYPYCPEYYYLGAVRNPTPFSILMYHINTDSQFREAVRSIEKKKVRYVIWDRTFSERAKWCWPTYSLPRKEDLIVEPYLAEHYQLLKRINGVDILERNENYLSYVRLNHGQERLSVHQ